MIKLHYILTLTLFACCAAGCAASPSIRTDKDPQADLSTYRTFGFFERLTTDRSAYSSILSSHLKQSTRAQLEKLGYVYDEQKPQLRVNFNLNIIEKQEIRTTPSAAAPGFYGYRAGLYGAWRGYPVDLQTIDYRTGTLSIDLVDAQRKVLVWQAVAEGRVRDSALRNPAAAVDTVVASMFAEFPNGAVQDL